MGSEVTTRDPLIRTASGYGRRVTDEHPVDPERVAAARDRALPVDDARDRAAVLALLADPLRARLLVVLAAAHEMRVGDRALALDASEDSTSYALRALRSDGLLPCRTEGRRLARLRLERVPVDDG